MTFACLLMFWCPQKWHLRPSLWPPERKVREFLLSKDASLRDDRTSSQSDVTPLLSRKDEVPVPAVVKMF